MMTLIISHPLKPVRSNIGNCRLGSDSVYVVSDSSDDEAEREDLTVKPPDPTTEEDVANKKYG